MSTTALPVLISCPACGVRHVDALEADGVDWRIRPHRKHLCKPSDGGCGLVFQVANFPTAGVAALPDDDNAALNLYRISQTVNRGYDTYSDAVVAAESPDAARLIHPASRPRGEDDVPPRRVVWCEDYKDAWEDDDDRRATWVSPDGDEEYGWANNPDEVRVVLIGIAAPDIVANTVLCASYYAG